MVIIYPCLFCAYFTGAQKAAIVRMITARMDTTNAVAHLTEGVIIMLIITEIVPCLLLLAQGAVLLGEHLRLQTHILTLEFETPSLSLIPHGVTYTEMTEDDTLIEPTIIVVAARLIPHNRGTLPRKGTRDKLRKLLIPLKEHRCPLEEERDLIPGADLQVLILSAAQAARAVAGVISIISSSRLHFTSACTTLSKYKPH